MSGKTNTKKTVRKDIRISGELLADIKLFCREKNIESEAELIREAIIKYIYSDDSVFKLQGIKTI
jgi:metal-responsive CopG/Arc/MetJ family transcriptional regulator